MFIYGLYMALHSYMPSYLAWVFVYAQLRFVRSQVLTFQSSQTYIYSNVVSAGSDADSRRDQGGKPWPGEWQGGPNQDHRDPEIVQTNKQIVSDVQAYKAI